MLQRCQTPAIPMSGGNSSLLAWKPVGFSPPKAIPMCSVTGWSSLGFWCMRTPKHPSGSSSRRDLVSPVYPTAMHSLSTPLPSPLQGSLLFQPGFPLLPLSFQATQEIGEQQFPCFICPVDPTVLPSGKLPTVQKAPINPTPQ